MPSSLEVRVRRSTLASIAIVLASLLLAAAAMRRTSTTFDETLQPSAGARGYVTGRFDLVTDHPPVMQYVYGLPVFLSNPAYPGETSDWSYWTRYAYAGTSTGRSGTTRSASHSGRASLEW